MSNQRGGDDDRRANSAAGGDGPACPAPEVSIRTAPDVAAEPVRWLWTEKVPKMQTVMGFQGGTPP